MHFQVNYSFNSKLSSIFCGKCSVENACKWMFQQVYCSNIMRVFLPLWEWHVYARSCNRFTVLNMYQKPPEDECHRSLNLKPFTSVSHCPLRNFKIEWAVMVVPVEQVIFSTVFMSARNICHLSVLQRSFESELQTHSCEGQQINHSGYTLTLSLSYRHTEQHINRVIQRFECPTFGLLNEKDMRKLSKQHLAHFGQAMALRR